MSGDKILVIGPSWVGDMVMAQALYRLLAERRPRAPIHVVAPEWSEAILARMPEVERRIALPVRHGELGLAKRYALGRRLRAERYSQAIVLPRSAKAALVPLFAGVPRRTGFRGEWRYGLLNDVRPFDPRRLDQTVKRFVALGLEPGEALPDALPRPRLAVDAANQRRLKERLGLEAPALLALMPGAEYGPAKRWPLERFAALAVRAANEGADVIVLGSARERPLGEAIAAQAGGARVRNLCGETSLADGVDLLAASAVAVTNDSGLMHVAAAVGTHVVAIYGSSSPRFTPALTDDKTVFWLELPCSPCFQRDCPLGHLRCLREIDADAVWPALARRLGDGDPAARRRADG